MVKRQPPIFNNTVQSQLVVTVHEIANQFAAGHQVDDKVPRGRLLHKLDYYGIRENTFHWIKSFLADRTQEVLLEGIHSSQANITSGLPQGTVLGPLLFLSYVNDLPDVVRSSCTQLFADDCRLFKNITNE